jgi:hypothetical protein
MILVYSFVQSRQSHALHNLLLQWREELMGKRVFIILCAWLLVFAAAATTTAMPVQWGDNGHWYEAISGEFTWDEAKSHAESLTHNGMTGHLATLTSLEENEFVWLNRRGKHEYLLGGERIDGDWTWVTGEIWTWDNWADGQGSNPSEDKLNFMDRDHGSWNDCSNVGSFPGFIVEYEPNDPAPRLNRLPFSCWVQDSQAS